LESQYAIDLQRIKVTKAYEDSEGVTRERASMEDLTTLPSRIFRRIIQRVGDDAANASVLPVINAYNTGKYQEAYDGFREVVDAFPELAREIYPHLAICQRVLSVQLDRRDYEYETRERDWEARSRLTNLLARFVGVKEPLYEQRCKHCGHYTPYIHPFSGVAWLKSNNCWRCQRGYPMADFAWDGVDGQAYIYYRRSVLEELFYGEFEAIFVVSPRWQIVAGKHDLAQIETQDDSDVILNVDLPVSIEDWGKRLGQEWLQRLEPARLGEIFDALVNEEDSLQDLLPEDLMQKRKSYIVELARAFEDDDEEFVCLELEMAIEEVVCDAHLANLDADADYEDEEDDS